MAGREGKQVGRKLVIAIGIRKDEQRIVHRSEGDLECSRGR
jgi:hypothetical protein